MKQLLILPFLLLFVFATAQEKPMRLGIFEVDLTEYRMRDKSKLAAFLELDMLKPNALNTISSQLISTYSNDPDFVIIDKRNDKYIADERERQKSEEFIDGYVIQQGKSEGMDYAMMPKYLVQDNAIVVRLIEVSTGLLKCEAHTELYKNKTGAGYTSFYTAKLIEQLNNKCFDKKFLVVRKLEQKGKKLKTILIAAGKNHKMKDERTLEVVRMTSETVGDQIFERAVAIGEIEIVKVEDANFSEAEVKKGNEEILGALDNGEQLYCRLLTKD